MFLIILLLLLIAYWYYSNQNEEAGFHYGRLPIRYDPSIYYNGDLDYYESPYVFFKRPKQNAYWECFELNKSIGASNGDAYQLCRSYID